MNDVIKKLLFIIAAVAVFANCQRKSSEMPAIFIDISRESKAYLSEIAEKVDMIKLETTSNSLIQEIIYVEILNDHYFIYHGVYSEVLMFDLNGQFVKKVGQIGRGPGEYIALTGIAVDAESRKLLVNSRELMMFNEDGIFVESVEHTNKMPTYMFVYNKQMYGVHQSSDWLDQGEGSNIFLTTRNTNDWKLIDSVYFTHFSGRRFFLPRNSLSQSNQNIYFHFHGIEDASGKTSGVDTLYVLENKETVPYLTAQVIGKGENGGYIGGIVMTDNYGIITHYISVKDPDARWPRSVYSQYYFSLHTMKGKNATNGFVDDFYSGSNVIIIPIPNKNMFFYYTSDYSSDLTTTPNPTLYIGTFKK